MHIPKELKTRIAELHRKAADGDTASTQRLANIVRIDSNAASFIANHLALGKLIVGPLNWTLAHEATRSLKACKILMRREMEAKEIMDSYGWSVWQEAWRHLEGESD